MFKRTSAQNRQRALGIIYKQLTWIRFSCFALLWCHKSASERPTQLSASKLIVWRNGHRVYRRDYCMSYSLIIGTNWVPRSWQWNHFSNRMSVVLSMWYLKETAYTIVGTALYVALWWTGDLSRVYPAYRPKTAGIGSSPRATWP